MLQLFWLIQVPIAVSGLSEIKILGLKELKSLE